MRALHRRYRPRWLSFTNAAYCVSLQVICINKRVQYDPLYSGQSPNIACGLDKRTQVVAAYVCLEATLQLGPSSRPRAMACRKKIHGGDLPLFRLAPCILSRSSEAREHIR